MENEEETENEEEVENKGEMENRDFMVSKEEVDNKVQILYFPSLGNPGLLGPPGLQELADPTMSLVLQRAPGPDGQMKGQLGFQSLTR